MSEQPVLVREHYRGGGPSDQGPGAAPPPGNGAPPPDGSGGGGVMSSRMGPLPVWGWLALAGVLAVGAYFWLKRARSGVPDTGTAASASQAATATNSGCYDAGGNSVPCSEADYASEIADLQAEIDNMQGGGSVPTSTPGAGSTLQVTVPDVIGDGAVQARATIQAAGLIPVVQGSGRGTVTSQSPGAGTVASVGDQVTLSVTGRQAATTASALPRVQQVKQA